MALVYFKYIELTNLLFSTGAVFDFIRCTLRNIRIQLHPPPLLMNDKDFLASLMTFCTSFPSHQKLTASLDPKL